MTHICAESAQHCTTHTHRTPSQQHVEQANSGHTLLKQRLTQFQDERSQTQHSIETVEQAQMSHSAPVGQIQFEEADPHTPVNSQRRLVTPPPVSSKVQRSGLVHIIGKDPPKIPNLFGDFATIVPDDDSQEQ